MGISQTKLDELELISEDKINQNNQDLNLTAVMEGFEKKYIKKLLDEHQWHKTRVASILGINRRTLFRKMKNYGIS
jgi:transcriptional regulator with PAS, ATPase and Fis domain